MEHTLNTCCDLCGEDIQHEDETVTITVVYGLRENDELRVDYALCSKGNLLYPPVLIHAECWQDAVGDHFSDVMGDIPGVAKRPLIDCAICRSQIEEEIDMFGMCQNGHSIAHAHWMAFVADDAVQPQAVCLDCLSAIETAWFTTED